VDGQAELTVRDSGTGIPEHEMPRLFERFHRVHNARGRTHEGSGIGLALVQELVTLHAGTIRAASVVDRGTTFTVRIPFGREHLPADAVGEAPAPHQRRRRDALRRGSTPLAARRVEASRRREGIASGERSPGADAVPLEARRACSSPTTTPTCATTSRDSSPAATHVETVTDGARRSRRPKRQKPDLIVSDVMMPQIDGIELLRALRDDENLRSIPVILLSARAGEESRLDGMQAGADDYLVSRSARAS